ncbi:MAG: DUF3015 domain-containing protein [Nitrospirae bacterium]|nr:DUF3015 domain-containing protein [Nitrospirota bacterium]
MKKYILAVIGAMLFSSSAFAAGYGDAGCGLGSLLFGETPGPVQILAATTNGTSFNQAFGITSGTSNCDAKGIVLAERQQEEFVANNFSGLAKEMAAGEGEHVTTLAGMLGCPTGHQSRFNTMSRKNYSTIFASDATTPAEMLGAVKTVMENDLELSAVCVN